MNHRAKGIIIRKIARIKTIGVTKMQGNFVEISFQAKFLRKARNFVKIRLHYFCTILYDLASASAHLLIKLASSVRVLLKRYGDTLRHLNSGIAEDLHSLEAVDRNFVRNGGTTRMHLSLCSWAGVSEQIANNALF